MKKKRNANIEALRILSMLMVIFLHALTKSDLLLAFTTENMQSPNTWIAWIIEMLCIGAVNIFILISGYFLAESEFKLTRLLEIVLQAVFYSLGAFAICFAFGIIDRSTLNIYTAMQLVFPIQTEVFWFVSLYVIVYVLQPILSKGMHAISQKQAKLIIGLLLLYECVMKSIVPSTLYTDRGGYSLLWFITVFLVGMYFRMYGFGFLKKSGRGLGLYFLASLINLVVIIGSQHVSLFTGRLKEFENISFCYNNIWVFLAAVGIFAFFAGKKEPGEVLSRVICSVSPMALGVYLVHENLSLRYRWQGWLGLTDILDKPVYEFVGKLLGAVLVVYIVGTLIDYLRILLFSLCKRIGILRK